jgi:hypothetical protein
MKLFAAQMWIFSVVLLSLAITLGGLYLGYLWHQYFADELQDLTLGALTQFSGPLSVMLGSYFAVRTVSKNVVVRKSIFVLAIICVFMYSLLTAGRTVAFIASADETVPLLVSWFAQVVTAATFLLTAVLAYFFASQESN